MSYTNGLDKPSDYFDTVTYQGSGGNNFAISSLDFAPNLTWIKRMTSTQNHFLFDTVRGNNKYVNSNTTDQEYTEANSFTFDSNGFTFPTYWDALSDSSGTTAAWNWKAGTSFTNDASATGIGTIDSTGSSNQTAGFSIVSYTSNGSSNQSVAHNLGGVPEMIISKNRDSGSASYNYWTVYHHSLATANDKKLKLNTTDAASTTNEWGDTDPTSTVYSLHTSGDGTTNHSTDKMISYCFRSIKGYSKFGSYTGNNSTNGPFIYCGFKPAWVLQKNTSITQGWQLQDNKRLGYNPDNYLLQPHTDQIESALQRVDLLSNGFKVRTTDAGQNGSGNNYIYMAFAEHPFVSSTGTPTTAR